MAISVRPCVRSAVRRKPASADTRHMAADGLGFGDFDARQRPGGLAQRLVAFEAELDHLPPGHRLAIDQPQLRLRLVLRLAQKVVAQPEAFSRAMA